VRIRVSILNLLLVTTIVALVIVVVRLNGELRDERAERIAMLQKGGILQVSDPDVVHAVQVYNDLYERSLRWRVYVPRGRRVTLSARLEPVPADRPVAPRLPPNASVVADRNPSNPINLPAGEHVISLSWERNAPHFTLEVVGVGPRRTRQISPADRNLDWFVTGAENITDVEHTKTTAQALADGRTVALADGKTFVLCRHRARTVALLHEDRNGKRQTRETNEMINELLLWLHPDEG
jgi:hypothetical protein